MINKVQIETDGMPARRVSNDNGAIIRTYTQTCC